MLYTFGVDKLYPYFDKPTGMNGNTSALYYFSALFRGSMMRVALKWN